MRLFFYRKPTVYVFYLLIFLFIEYVFVKLFLPGPVSEDTDNKSMEIDSNRIIREYIHKITVLEETIEALKKSNQNCEEKNSRQNKLALFNQNKEENQCEGDKVGETFIRDFYNYECKSIRRYPPMDDGKRIDGSYYLCEDGGLKPKHSDCIVLSFGIYNNDMFDEAINKELNCLVHSMDPFNEPTRITDLRSTNSSLKNAVTLEINKKWKFHSLGITNEERIREVNKLGWLDTYEHILNYLNLNGKIIDCLKIDTEGAEWESIPYIMSTKPELLCKYVKQLALETHSWLYTHSSNYKVLKSLEVCFRLYKRDHRFYMAGGGTDTEWQMGNFELPLNKFKDEVDLARFLFLYGELYFINKNFL